MTIERPFIKSIETAYGDNLYRSRAEARWAVWMDRLRIRFRYESEGFEFEDGTRYLPDFWLTDLKCWLEIKGQPPTDDELQRLEYLHYGTDAPAFVVWGSPGDMQEADGVFHLGTESGGGIMWLRDDYDAQLVVGVCSKCGRTGIEVATDKESLVMTANWDAWGGCCGELEAVHPDILAAARIASQARFEFGQTPRRRK